MEVTRAGRWGIDTLRRDKLEWANLECFFSQLIIWKKLCKHNGLPTADVLQHFGLQHGKYDFPDQTDVNWIRRECVWGKTELDRFWPPNDNNDKKHSEQIHHKRPLWINRLLFLKHLRFPLPSLWLQGNSPFIQNNCNVGYGFINFVNTSYLHDFYLEFHNRGWGKFKSEKVFHYIKIDLYPDICPTSRPEQPYLALHELKSP